MSNLEKVREFHEVYGHPVAKELTVQTPELRALRVQLIAEELAELARASGIALTLITHPLHHVEDDIVVVCGEFSQGAEPYVDLIEMSDACGDLEYVVLGASLVFGLPAQEVFDEIHASNMSKLGDDGKPIYREDGKILKGPNFVPPDIAKVLVASCGT